MNDKTEQKPSERPVPPEPTASLTPMPEKANLKTGGNMMAIVPQSIDETWRLATIITTANMAPKSYNRDASAVMVGIMHGLEIGLKPMAALQAIAVINGQPSIWGDGALGLVRASGLIEDFSETMDGEGDSRCATCSIQRKGEKSPIVRKFSMADAKTASLTGKDPWKKYPQRMLQMRARSWAMRDGFADVLKGLHISEEVMDMTNGGALVDRGDGVLVPADAPARPKPGDYIDTPKPSPVKPEPSPIFIFTDEYGQPVGEMLFDAFVDGVLSKIQELSQGDDGELLEAFWLYNTEAIEELGSVRSSIERQDINLAYNEARATIEAKASDEQGSETSEDNEGTADAET